MLLPLLMNLRMLGEGNGEGANGKGAKGKQRSRDQKLINRLRQAEADSLGITAKLATEFTGKQILTVSEIQTAEIATLLHKRVADQNDEALALILIMAGVN